MKLIGLEEHFVTSDIVAAWKALDPRWQDVALTHSSQGDLGRCLMELGEERIEAMNATGLDLQVLSLTAPGVQSLDADDAIALQRASNDLLADLVRSKPEHYQGFAVLATPDPKAAARELERAIKQLGLHGAMLYGHTRDSNLDAAANEPIFEVASALRAPLYLHPQSPVLAVREANYNGFSPAVDGAFATHGLGWHYETGLQILRLILAGVFDRYPDLQIVTGHWGEVVLFYLDRIDELQRTAKHLQRPISEYFRHNISVTSSGIWSQRYLRWSIEVLGVERIMFSTDYPYRFEPGSARRFLHESGLNEADKAAIAHGNWERMIAGIRR